MNKTRLWNPNFCKGAPLVVGQLAENHRRWVAGLLAQALGNVKAVAELLDMDRKTVLRGRTEVEAGLDGLGRVRRSGAGGKPAEEKDPTLEKDLWALVEADTAGDPMTNRKWTRKSLRQLARELGERGHTVSKDTIARLLKKKGTHSRAIGSGSPDRPTQTGTCSSSTLRSRSSRSSTAASPSSASTPRRKS